MGCDDGLRCQSTNEVYPENVNTCINLNYCGAKYYTITTTAVGRGRTVEYRRYDESEKAPVSSGSVTVTGPFIRHCDAKMIASTLAAAVAVALSLWMKRW